MAAAGVIGAVALTISSCQQLSLKSQIKGAVQPANPTSPWITAYGDRSVALTWAEPPDPDMGAVEVIATPTHGTAGVVAQAVIKQGQQGITLTVPSNNVGYTFTIYMVDKGGNVSSDGASTQVSHSLHYLLDTASQQVLFSNGFPPLDQFTCQLPVTRVTHFSGEGAGAPAGYDTYTYDTQTHLPSVITTYDTSGNPVMQRQIEYAAGSADRVLDLISLYSGSGWTLDRWLNTYYDAAGRVVKTEYYGGPSGQGSTPKQLRLSSVYNYDASGTLTGWVTSDALGNVYRRVSYINLGNREQWATMDASGVLIQNPGLIEADFDSSGHITKVIEYDTHDMSIAFEITFEYDTDGNQTRVAYLTGSTLLQQGYNIYSY